MSRIKVQHSESGCWKVMRGEYVLAVYPKRMWKDALYEAQREAIYQNLSIIGMEVTR